MMMCSSSFSDRKSSSGRAELRREREWRVKVRYDGCSKKSLITNLRRACVIDGLKLLEYLIIFKIHIMYLFSPLRTSV